MYCYYCRCCCWVCWTVTAYRLYSFHFACLNGFSCCFFCCRCCYCFFSLLSFVHIPNAFNIFVFLCLFHSLALFLPSSFLNTHSQSISCATHVLTDDMTDVMHKNEYKSASSNGQSQSGRARKPINLIPFCDHFTVDTKWKLATKKHPNKRHEAAAATTTTTKNRHDRQTKVVSRVLVSSHFAYEANAF